MIARLRGTVAAVGDGQALIDVGGVGYVLHAGSRTLSRLTVGAAGEVFVETQMSENAIKLYGFAVAEERAWFARLQDAPGVGAKVALAILDTLAPNELMDALALGDVASIQRANGVGKKLAERIVTEFKGKPPPSGLFAMAATGAGGEAAPIAPAGGARSDAVSALVARDLGADAGEGDLIRVALKGLAPSG